MLISFTVDNWMSFYRPATFSMVATKERQHGDRLARAAKYSLRVLPVAAVYGGQRLGQDQPVQGPQLCQEPRGQGDPARGLDRRGAVPAGPGGRGPALPFWLSDPGRGQHLRFELCRHPHGGDGGKAGRGPGHERAGPLPSHRATSPNFAGYWKRMTACVLLSRGPGTTSFF